MVQLTPEEVRRERRLLMARYLLLYPEDAGLPFEVVSRAAARIVLARAERPVAEQSPSGRPR